MSERHSKRKGELMPARLARKQAREHRDPLEPSGDYTDMVADWMSSSRKLGIGDELSPEVQRLIDGRVSPRDAVLQRIVNKSYQYQSIANGA
ncbi:MAG: hypothetical protein NUV84_04120, partial [Candidatus Uhrbacteria bacterium]|nr:hypothetical protein [Candidatus Uhrbacteria bacterium]